MFLISIRVAETRLSVSGLEKKPEQLCLGNPPPDELLSSEVRVTAKMAPQVRKTTRAKPSPEQLSLLNPDPDSNVHPQANTPGR